MYHGAREAWRRMMVGASIVKAMTDDYIKRMTFKTARDCHPTNARYLVLIPILMVPLEAFYVEDDDKNDKNDNDDDNNYDDGM